MPFYTYRRQLTPRKINETPDQVKARIRREIEERTQERVIPAKIKRVV
jgi:hypothetical protein